PFPTVDPNTYAVGPLTADAAGNIYYNVLQLSARPGDPWLVDSPNSWLVRIAVSDAPRAVAWSTLVPGTPRATDQCAWQYSNDSLPWPVLRSDGAPAPPPTMA